MTECDDLTHRKNKARKRKTYTATLPLLCHDECC